MTAVEHYVPGPKVAPPRPPSPAYYRRLAIGWNGGVDESATVRTVEGVETPKVVNGEVVVTTGWLRRVGARKRS